mmetsp:Transcript_6612/g.10600  ORF Transcript_6612/g.10600 Transcript_6612/m.10600 type:complete len:318 (-) Transcript_6612:190-1143(-)
MAFTRATIERTNEVMVNLGGGVFVKQSAYQACGVLERRKLSVQGDIQEIKTMLGHRQRDPIVSQQQPSARAVQNQAQTRTQKAASIDNENSNMKNTPGGFVELRETLEESRSLAQEASDSGHRSEPTPRKAFTEEERAQSRAIWDQFAKLEEENDPEALAAAEAALQAQEDKERAEAQMSMDDFYSHFLNKNKSSAETSDNITTMPEYSATDATMALDAISLAKSDSQSMKSSEMPKPVTSNAAKPTEKMSSSDGAFSGEIIERSAEAPSMPTPLPAIAPTPPPQENIATSSTSAEAAGKPKRVSLFKKNLAAHKPN